MEKVKITVKIEVTHQPAGTYSERPVAGVTAEKAGDYAEVELSPVLSKMVLAALGDVTARLPKGVGVELEEVV